MRMSPASHDPHRPNPRHGTRAGFSPFRAAPNRRPWRVPTTVHRDNSGPAASVFCSPAHPPVGHCALAQPHSPRFSSRSGCGRRVGPEADHTRYSLAKVHASPTGRTSTRHRRAIGVRRSPCTGEPTVTCPPATLSSGVSRLKKRNVARKRSSRGSSPEMTPNGSHMAAKRTSKR